MNHLKTILLPLSLSISLSLSGQDQLNGKTFLISVTELNADGRIEKMDPDILTFSKGEMKTRFSEKNGFAPALFSEESPEGSDEVKFAGTSSGKDGIELIWEGTIKGKKAEGTATRKGGLNSGAVYQFSGIYSAGTTE